MVSVVAVFWGSFTSAFFCGLNGGSRYFPVLSANVWYPVDDGFATSSANDGANPCFGGAGTLGVVSVVCLAGFGATSSPTISSDPVFRMGRLETGTAAGWLGMIKLLSEKLMSLRIAVGVGTSVLFSARGAKGSGSLNCSQAPFKLILCPFFSAPTLCDLSKPVFELFVIGLDLPS